MPYVMIDLDDEEKMMGLYKKTRSVKQRIYSLKNILKNEGISFTKRERLVSKLLYMFVPAGTKGVVKGRLFNKIVEEKILVALKKKKGYRFSVEEKHPLFQEIPDWILCKGKKTLVGFNQISLFGGGHQMNRGSKYILDDTLHRRLAKKNVRMVCIVNKFPDKKNGGKAWKIVSRGLEKKRLYTPDKIKKLLEEFLT